MEFPDLVGQLRDDVKQIADDSVVGHLEDRRVLVLVDRDDDFRRAHPRQVLDRARDADGDVERGADGFARLAHLVGMRPPPRIHHRARRPHRRRPPQRARQLLHELEAGRLLEAAPTRHDDRRFGHVQRPRLRRLDLAHRHPAPPPPPPPPPHPPPRPPPPPPPRPPPRAAHP